MRRTTYPNSTAIAIHYRDLQRIQRWGIWVKETSTTVVVRNIVNEVIKVPIQNVLDRKEVDPFFLQTDITLQDVIDHYQKKAQKN